MAAQFAIHNLAKSAGGSGSLLFSRISAEWTEPQMIALTGKSGQGKSTLLRILALLDVPDEGDILLNGQSFRQADPRKWRMAVSYVAQHAVMLPGSINDNLSTASRLHGLAYDTRLAEQLMGQLGLDYLSLSKPAAECSGGEQQRIALIRTLLLRPDILLLDEVTASLDKNSAAMVEALLTKWHKEEGGSLIWVTHDPEQAGRIAGRAWVMREGTMEEHDNVLNRA